MANGGMDTKKFGALVLLLFAFMFGIMIMPLAADLVVHRSVSSAKNTLEANGYTAFADQDGDFDVGGDLDVTGDITAGGAFYGDGSHLTGVAGTSSTYAAEMTIDSLTSSSVNITGGSIIGTFLLHQGTAAEIDTVVLEEGELGYCTDTHELRKGDGSTAGGLNDWSFTSLSITESTDILGDMTIPTDEYSSSNGDISYATEDKAIIVGDGNHLNTITGDATHNILITLLLEELSGITISNTKDVSPYASLVLDKAGPTTALVYNGYIYVTFSSGPNLWLGKIKDDFSTVQYQSIATSAYHFTDIIQQGGKLYAVTDGGALYTIDASDITIYSGIQAFTVGVPARTVCSDGTSVFILGDAYTRIYTIGTTSWSTTATNIAGYDFQCSLYHNTTGNIFAGDNDSKRICVLDPSDLTVTSSTVVANLTNNFVKHMSSDASTIVFGTASSATPVVSVDASAPDEYTVASAAYLSTLNNIYAGNDPLEFYGLHQDGSLRTYSCLEDIVCSTSKYNGLTRGTWYVSSSNLAYPMVLADDGTYLYVVIDASSAYATITKIKESDLL